MEKVILDLVKNIYNYAYKKGDKYYSPVSFSKTEGSIALPLDNDGQSIKDFVLNVLAKNIFIANSKTEFLKSIKSEVIACIDMDFEDFINNEIEVDNFLKDSEGYLNYIDGETLYVIFNSIDSIKCFPASMMGEELKADLLDSLYYNRKHTDFTPKYSLIVNSTIGQKDELFNLMASELVKTIN